MGEYSEAFVAFDVAKTKHAVAIADGGRGSEVRFLGDVANTPAAVERLIRKLGGRYKQAARLLRRGTDRLRAISPNPGSRYACLVVAPALIPSDQASGSRPTGGMR